ncbi:MAG: aminoglycoside 6-adenylyltransferase [Leptospiraceae bacterium]|nr:aminoglycoside 6-adenylyltransferase [Leptospiraceae bacterium]
MEKFQSYIDSLVKEVQNDNRFLAVCIAGSSISGELDEFSDLDIVLITENDIIFEPKDMIQFASGIGELLVGFTGEHVGEKRLLICLYDSPLLHVDIKFVKLEDFNDRVEDPKILYDKLSLIPDIYSKFPSHWPKVELQWIEDRFWVWIHYAATKLGRRELFESIDFLAFLRSNVLGPMLHLKYKKDPRGVRKLDFFLSDTDLEKLKNTYPSFEIDSIFNSILTSIDLYLELRDLLSSNILKQEKVRKQSVEYLKNLMK